MDKNHALGIILTFSFIYISNFSFLKSEKVEFTRKIEIGSEQKKGEIFFLPRDVKTDQKGNIFVLDSGDNCIYKFSESGVLLKKAGRKGQGPGEMDRPAGIAIDSSGNIYLNDPFNRRINIYDDELNYLETIRMDRFYVNLFFIGRNLLMLSRPTTPEEKYFHLFSGDGKYLMSFHDEFHPYLLLKQLDEKARGSSAIYLFGIANLNQNRTIIGFTHMIPENPMKIYLMNKKGEIQKIIKKSIIDYDAKDQFEITKSSFSIKKNYTFRQVLGLHFTRMDYLIIQRRDGIYKEGILEESLFRLDIFSPEGNLVKEEIEFDGTIFHIDRNDNVYVQIEDESGFFKIRVYSLKISQWKLISSKNRNKNDEQELLIFLTFLTVIFRIFIRGDENDDLGSPLFPAQAIIKLYPL